MSFLDTEPTIKVDLTTTTCDNLVVEILKTVILDDLSSDLIEDELKNAKQDLSAVSDNNPQREMNETILSIED